MKKLTIGVLAHVDAGKTTLCEAMLYISKTIKHLGRVDNRDTFLDTYFEERRRGITIFSKIARLNYKDTLITLIDTPGHADFSSEMERSLQILDYAILIISGTSGIQSHTLTLFKLLEKYHIPTFIFITKMDVAKVSKEEILVELSAKTKIPCIKFSDNIDYESIAVLEDALLEKYLNTGSISTYEISSLIHNINMYPVLYGSGLKLDGIEDLLNVIVEYSIQPKYSEQFSARVFKIARDEHGKRLTYIKINGGQLAVKSTICEEKINEIRFYSGSKYDPVNLAVAGDVCALTGLSKTKPGEDLQSSNIVYNPTIESVLNYSVILPTNVDAITILPKFKELEEEDPTLHVAWNQMSKTISVNLMGKIQIEVLTSIFKDRFNLDIAFSSGNILYKETINSTVEGIGHYEPLKHYAEVHLLMEPLPVGSGIVVNSTVSTDNLDINYQNLIITHVLERTHLGVLTGSPITDIKITLIAGKAHLKHTEGGDFRQATYRAIRHGLMKAECILLEPIYDFYIEVPSEFVGRTISDLHIMDAKVNPIETINDCTLISGYSPVRTISDYYNEIISYTHGKGRISLCPAGYIPCNCQQKIVQDIDYNPLNDENNSPSSIFCSHGVGINVPWNEVESYCHIPMLKNTAVEKKEPALHHRINLDDDELEQIMNREFGPIKRKQYTKSENYFKNQNEDYIPLPTTIIIDGYNVIYSWDDLKQIAVDNIDLAREKLITQLVNFQAYTNFEIILVFDAYLISGGKGSKYDESKVHIIYTQEGETADAYIERFISEVGKNKKVKVVSNDSLIQVSAVKSGVLRVSTREFKYDLDEAIKSIRKLIE